MGRPRPRHLHLTPTPTLLPSSRMENRYSRQILFPPIGLQGQRRVAASHAVIVGCGALGCAQSMLLARAGVGTLTLIDRDYVERSNLQRQILFDELDADTAAPKAIAAQRRLAAINSEIEIRPIVDDLDARNIADLLGGAHIVLDATDNFETRYLINDWSVREQVPWIYGAAVGSYGISLPVIPARAACFRCIYPAPPSGDQPTCETAGVLNSVTTAVGAWQAAAALRLLSASSDDMELRILTMDVWTGVVRSILQPARDPQCPCCGARDFAYLDRSRRAPVSLCGRNAVQIHDRGRPLDLEQLRNKLTPLGRVRANDFALRFELEPYEMTIFPDGRAIIKGTTDIAQARSLYSRYIGN
jgi:molybdopterin/thiamine biosynthesis adenylyltransferase